MLGLLFSKLPSTLSCSVGEELLLLVSTMRLLKVLGSYAGDVVGEGGTTMHRVTVALPDFISHKSVSFFFIAPMDALRQPGSVDLLDCILLALRKLLNGMMTESFY